MSDIKRTVKSRDAIWISWENHRRTQQLSEALSVELKVFHSSSNRFIRYISLVSITGVYLLHRRPRVLIVQNPSLILTTFACLLRSILKYRLIVDRHTNFRLSRAGDQSGYEKMFRAISNWTLRKSDLTIVTNEFLRKFVADNGGRAIVLPDRIPSIAWTSLPPSKIEGRYIVFVSTFSNDEPVEAVLNAAQRFNGILYVAVTGRFRSPAHEQKLRKIAPSNVIFTGFLDDKDYLALLQHAELIIVLTTIEYCLTCGAYEAVSAGKAMILSDTQAIQQYFSGGAVYCEPTAESIASTINDALSRREELELETKKLRTRLMKDWSERFETASTLIFSGSH